MIKTKTKTKRKAKQQNEAPATNAEVQELVTIADQAPSVQPECPSQLEQQRPQSLAEILKDQPVYVNSIAAGMLGLGRGSVLRELQHAAGLNGALLSQ
jgi:hypothetical protein